MLDRFCIIVNNSGHVYTCKVYAWVKNSGCISHFKLITKFSFHYFFLNLCEDKERTPHKEGEISHKEGENLFIYLFDGIYKLISGG